MPKSLSHQAHKSEALWAADCAERVLLHFESKCPTDERPRMAIEAGRAWTRGEISVSAARSAAFAAHAAARSIEDAAARAAARSAGHAAATAHVVGHARHAAAYAVKAAIAVSPLEQQEAVTISERNWQLTHRLSADTN